MSKQSIVLLVLKSRDIIDHLLPQRSLYKNENEIVEMEKYQQALTATTTTLIECEIDELGKWQSG